jgi:hypothetical protein
MTLSTAHFVRLFSTAVPLVNIFNGLIEEDEELKSKDPGLLCIAALMFAGGLAKLSKLDYEGFRDLASHAFLHTQVSSKDEADD